MEDKVMKESVLESRLTLLDREVALILLPNMVIHKKQKLAGNLVLKV